MFGSILTAIGVLQAGVSSVSASSYFGHRLTIVHAVKGVHSQSTGWSAPRFTFCPMFDSERCFKKHVHVYVWVRGVSCDARLTAILVLPSSSATVRRRFPRDAAPTHLF
ncbi:hypothetical protein IE81DRAFT_215415 [Ceraceosorus guamensis]|uniref:Secreted protein n=1 Tax=Ceraceosorus guamensis TaxID=1522189 RepID=A0A316VSX5_9BASI|nr:hypothetical protein IE81DRAFT_215415 [Ceraceosorus guamensis]PWN40592.1 hypothetical protein IE81DRAFT_215415 [Ceraceosorus guamensis]